MAKARFRIFKGKGESTQRWRWHLIGANNKILASGEGYLTKWSAKRGVRRFVVLAAKALIEEEKSAR